MDDLPTPDIEAYVGGNQQACYVQLVDFLSTVPAGEEKTDVGRALAFEIASKVGARYCSHVAAPEPMEDMSHAGFRPRIRAERTESIVQWKALFIESDVARQIGGAQ